VGQLIGRKTSVLVNWSELSAGCGVATLKNLGIHREGEPHTRNATDLQPDIGHLE